MRAAVIFGPGSHERDLQPFQRSSQDTWTIGLPASSSDADTILIFGGDGTVHRHLAQLVKLRLPVLVVPCGSGNDFARALRLRRTRDSEAAWRKFSAGGGNLRSIDLGVITPLGNSEPPHYFCCVGGVGLDSEVARRANELPRWLRGHGGYVVSFPPALFRFAPLPMKISLPDRAHPGEWQASPPKPVVLAAFANTPAYGGGMKIAPQARMDDGQLDLCIIRDISKLKLFCLFPTVFFGRHIHMPEVEYVKAERLRIETGRPLDVYGDGEYVCQTSIEVTVAPAALQVMMGGD